MEYAAISSGSIIEIFATESYKVERMKRFLNGVSKKGGRLNEGDLFVWNGFASKLGWRDSSSSVLEERKKKYGIGDRTDILTIPDLIDFDEGRFPEATKTA